VNFDRRCAVESFERSLSALASLCRYARETDQPLQLTTQGMCETYGLGPNPLDRLLRWLAQAQPLPHDAESLPTTAPAAIRLPRAVPLSVGDPA
jgi:hypothetical protein